MRMFFDRYQRLRFACHWLPFSAANAAARMDTRVSLDSVIMAFNQGATPEQIVQDYDTLDLSQVYAAISYYLQHRDEIDSYLADRGHRREELRAQYNPHGIREKLLARRRNVA